MKKVVLLIGDELRLNGNFLDYIFRHCRNGDLDFDEIKTKSMAKVLENIKVSKALVVLSDSNINVEASARNIPNIKTTLVNTINTYDILKYDTLVVTKDAVAKIEEVYA